jgi:hypothetical protein
MSLMRRAKQYTDTELLQIAIEVLIELKERGLVKND